MGVPYRYGITPLHNSAYDGQMATAQLLSSYGANRVALKWTSQFGFLTPADLAHHQGHTALFDWLCETGPHMVHCYTVHLPLGALLIACTMCGTGRAPLRAAAVALALRLCGGEGST